MPESRNRTINRMATMPAGGESRRVAAIPTSMTVKMSSAKATGHVQDAAPNRWMWL